MSLTSGTRIGAFEVTGRLGAGGMGEVYRARDTRLGRDVALKLLPEVFAANPERLARFEREARTLASLNHPSIAGLHGVEDSGGQLALVMELVEGEDLAVVIARGPIALDDALPIARQIADALEAAHGAGIIHRDLKPANIKVRTDGTVKVLDFGLAKALDPGDGHELPSDTAQSPTITSPAMTLRGVILGTAAYMSPEQARGKAVDKRTDVWAFGCVLYEMLTGRRAFGHDEVSDTLAYVLTKDVDWMALPPATPPPVRRLLARCLQKDRALRLRDLGDANLDLRDAAAPPSEAVADPRRTSSRLALGVTLGAMAGAAITAGLLWALSPPPPARDIRRFVVTLPSGLSLVGSGLLNRTVAVSPDGKSLAYSALDGRVYLRRFDSLDMVSLPIGLTAVGPIFSPDGHHIAAFGAGTAELGRIPITGGPVQPIARGAGVGRGASWAPDGTIYLATTDPASGLLSVRDIGGELKALTTPDAAAGELDHFWPEVLPEGRAVLFTVVRNGSYDIGVLDLASGATKVLLRGGSNAQYLATGHLLYASAGALRAVPFDPVRLELRGEPVALPLPVMITGSGVVNAAAAPNGTLVYAGGDPITASERRLAWVDRQGREEMVESPPQPFAVPRSAPDGLRVVAHLERDIPDIVVLDIRRKSVRPLTLAKVPSIRPAWSVDGRWIFFRSETEGQGIYRKAADGSGATSKITPVIGDASVHSLSPDGKWLIYAQISPSTLRDLWMIDPEGAGKPQPLVVEPGDQSNAVVSPDSRWIAYHASESGEIYVRPFPNVADGRWQVVPSGAKWPLWSRDGKELFFVSGTSIMSVAVEGGPTFEWNSPSRLFDVSGYSGFAGLAGPRNYDLSPDGKRFLVIKDSGLDRAQTREFVVVENWFDELNRLAPPVR